MGRYQQDAKELLAAVGGKENIAAVSHCVTRMRFVLNDPAKADVPRIEKIKSAKGTFTQAGQFQVIIGNTVSDFYNDFVAVSGIEGVSKDAVKSAAKQNQNPAQKVMSALAEIFAPLIPAMLAAFTLVYLEKFFRKICPAVVSMIVVPFCSLVLSVMAAHFVLGPIGWAIGSAVSSAVYAATSTTANSVGVGGLPGILSIQPASMLSFALCMAIAMVVPFVLTVAMGKKKGVQ